MQGSSGELRETVESSSTELQSRIKTTLNQSLLEEALKEQEAATNRSKRLEVSMKRRKQEYET